MKVLRFSTHVGALAVCVAALASAASAQTIDQQQTTSNSGFVATQRWALQSFTPTVNTVAGGGFWLAANGSTSGTLTIDLWNEPPNTGGATKLASGTVTLGPASGYYDAFWSPVNVTTGVQYYLVFATPGQNVNYTSQANSSDATYAGGTGECGSWTTGASPGAETDPYNQCTRVDTKFREYSTGPDTVTPEPGSLALLGTGLFGLAPLAARRRRR